MALPATHFRFALALVGDLGIVSVNAYLSGTLYPDSRWHTGVARGLTHREECLALEFGRTDFHVGWHVHCRCDQIQKRLLRSRFPDIASGDGERQWIALSAAKMVQDQGDMAAIDIESCLGALDTIQTPNGERADLIRRYFAGVRDVYRGKKRLGPDDYHELWRMIGLDRDLLDSMMAAYEDVRSNAQRVQEICAVHDAMVQAFRNALDSPAARNTDR